MIQGIRMDEIIINLMEQVGNKIVNRVGVKWPSYYNDFKSVAMITTWQVVGKYGEDVDPRVLSRAIKRKVREAMFDLVPLFGPSARTRFRSKDYELPEVLEFQPEHDVPVYDPIDEEDVITSLSKTTMESTVIRLRLDGMTYKEIAEVLGCSDSNVHLIMKRIRKRENIVH